VEKQRRGRMSLTGVKKSGERLNKERGRKDCPWWKEQQT